MPKSPPPSKNQINPQKKAVSLEYSGQGAPIVSAKGTGLMAEQILQLAKENDIPVMQDVELTALLEQVELNDEIPDVLYEAVAQVLIFAYEMSGKSFPTIAPKD